jgi:hypothetical protein
LAEKPQLVQVVPERREAACGLGRLGVWHGRHGVRSQAGVPVGPGALPAPRLGPAPRPGDQGIVVLKEELGDIRESERVVNQKTQVP